MLSHSSEIHLINICSMIKPNFYQNSNYMKVLLVNENLHLLLFDVTPNFVNPLPTNCVRSNY